MKITWDECIFNVLDDSLLCKQLKSGKGREPETTKFLRSYLKPHMVFVDVGANVGYYTLLAAKRCKHVYAFEPDTRFLPYLYENVSANSFSVTVIGMPLYDKVTQVSLSKSGPPWLVREVQVGIRTTTLDKCLTHHVDVIKIDVDGTEFNVLRGADSLIHRSKPAIVLENHLEPGERDKMFKWLTDRHYGIRELENRRYLFT